MTIDDMNPEVYGHVMYSLFETGALDVYYTPVQMKKNRPGVELTVICEEGDAAAIAAHVMAQTTTLGVRVAREERFELERRVEAVETELGTVRVKVAELPGGGERVSPEFDSCREIARSTGRTLLEVYEIARNAWRGRT